MLTNTISALPSIAAQLVPQYLLGDLPPAASGVGDLKPYLGRYIANFATFSNEVFTISERNGRLVLDMPSQLESALNPPRADGRWPLVMTDQLAVSFDRDNTGRVVGLKLHEGGMEFEVPREGVVLTPEIPLSELQKYVGRYRRCGRRDRVHHLHPEPAPRGPAAEQHLVRSPSARRHRTPGDPREHGVRRHVRGIADRRRVRHELPSPGRAAGDAAHTRRVHPADR